MDKNTDTLEHVADECERLERACRDITPPLARLLNIAAWIAVEAQIKAEARAPVRRTRRTRSKTRQASRLRVADERPAPSTHR